MFIVSFIHNSQKLETSQINQQETRETNYSIFTQQNVTQQEERIN